jgi:hypothetical protein
VFDGFVQPIAVYHMSIWALLCTCIVVVCFLWIAWIYVPKARTFLVVLNLTADALFDVFLQAPGVGKTGSR